MKIASKVAGLAAACMMAALVTTALPAMAFPEKPVTMIVPYGKGGGSDQLSRAMAESIEKTTKIKFDVVNMPGKGGLKAIPEFMRRPNDGYTVIEHIDDAVAAYSAGNIQENPARDWVPLGIAQITFSQIFIRPNDKRFSDWKSFLAYAKANPGELVIANVSYDGSMELVNMQRLEAALGFRIRQVSFDKPKERYAALIYERVDALFEQPGDVSKFLDAGQMKPILTFFDERPSAFAKVPTHREAGADFDALLRFRGFYVRSGVPDDRLAVLGKMFQKGFNSGSFQAFNRKKFMHLINSYRNTSDAITLIDDTVKLYQAAYADMLFEEYQKRIKTQ